MSIFNEHGNLESTPCDIVSSGNDALWAKIEPLLENLSSVEIRALEQAVVLGISVRFGEYRIRREMKKWRERRMQENLHQKGNEKVGLLKPKPEV
jgi:hypothetical protein